jgi:hypothetical protein
VNIQHFMSRIAMASGAAALLMVGTGVAAQASVPPEPCDSLNVVPHASTRTSGPTVVLTVSSNSCGEQFEAYGHATQQMGHTDTETGHPITTGKSTADLPDRANEQLCSWGFEYRKGTSGAFKIVLTGKAPPKTDPCTHSPL